MNPRAQGMPAFPNFKNERNIRFDVTTRALNAWNPAIRAAEDDTEDNSISIFGVIGNDMWGDGITANRIGGALRRIGRSNPVSVNINSPGGDMFEGIAIYNQLLEHKGPVTVNVLGLAASAASVIAMGAEPGLLKMARSSFMMIHNAWVIALGNRNDLVDIADWLKPFDQAMADVYSVRTGDDRDEMLALMDAETYMGGTDAIERGFADTYLDSDRVVEDANASADRIAAHKLDVALAKAGMPRTERRRLLNDYKAGMRNAAGDGTPGAADPATQNAGKLQLEPLTQISFNH